MGSGAAVPAAADEPASRELLTRLYGEMGGESGALGIDDLVCIVAAGWPLKFSSGVSSGGDIRLLMASGFLVDLESMGAPCITSFASVSLQSLLFAGTSSADCPYDGSEK